jgi:hypothetical protein
MALKRQTTKAAVFLEEDEDEDGGGGHEQHTQARLVRRGAIIARLRQS